MQKSLTFNDIGKIIRNINPRCRFKIKTYDYVDSFPDIASLMNSLDALILLYRTDPMYGHYCVLTKCDTPEYLKYIETEWDKRTTLPVYCFSDSYGYLVDKQLNFVPDRLKGILGQEFPYLKTLLVKCPNIVEWNNYHLQGDNANTCGRYAALRAAEFYVPLETWVKRLRVGNADKTIVKLTDSYLLGKTHISEKDTSMYMPSKTSQLRGMGLSKAQISSVNPKHYDALIRHMAGGNQFTDFFKTLFSAKNVRRNFLEPLRDYVNPVLAKSIPYGLSKVPIPGLDKVGKAFELLSDAYLKAAPPMRGPFSGKGVSKTGGEIAVSGGERGMAVSGGERGMAVSGGKMRHCSLCGTMGAVKTTCPMNPYATVRSFKRHRNVRNPK